MAGVTEPFDVTVARHCPSDARYYFCERVGETGEPIRFPTDRALRIQPFEWPVGARACPWMVRYCKDSQGREVVPHVAGKAQVIAQLRYPSEVCDKSEQSLDAEIAAALAQAKVEPEIEDDAEGSLKSARIDAKKRELALEIASKEQKLLLRSAKNKEIAEGYLLNRSHRQEVRAQSEAMYKLQHQSVEMLERNFVLMEKMQESFGRYAEMEKSAAQRTASPPPPVDYSPVLGSVVSAIRDIGVSALQRDERKKLSAGDEPAPVRAALSEKGTSADTTLAAKESAKESFKELPSAAAKDTASTVPTSSATHSATVEPVLDSPVIRDLLAKVERMQEKAERLQAELATERNRQRVLDEISARPDVTRPSSARASHPARQTLSDHRTPRNVPVSPREPSARSSGSAQHPSSPRPTSRSVQTGAKDPARESHPAQQNPSARTSQSGQRALTARSTDSAQPSSLPRPTSRSVQSGAKDPARESHPAQQNRSARTSQSGQRDLTARSTDSAQPSSSPRPPSRSVQTGAKDPARDSHPAQQNRSARTSQSVQRDLTARSTDSAQPSPSTRSLQAEPRESAAWQMPSPRSLLTPSARTLQAGLKARLGDPPSSPHASSRQSGLTARWARQPKLCPCGSGRRFKHCCMLRSRPPAGPQSPQARDAKPMQRALSSSASAPAQEPTPKTLPPSERPGEAAPPSVESQPIEPQTATAHGPGAESGAAAAAGSNQAHATSEAAKPTSPTPTFPIPTGGLRNEVQELLVNMLAGNLLDETDTPIPRPRVAEVKHVEKVVVEAPQMDPETAQRLLTDGTTLESLGAYLFFNPAVRSELLSRRAK